MILANPCVGLAPDPTERCDIGLVHGLDAASTLCLPLAPQGSTNSTGNKLGGAVDSLKDRKALQRDPDNLEGWEITSHYQF